MTNPTVYDSERVSEIQAAQPERILLVTQLPQGTAGSVYKHYLSDATRSAKKHLKLSRYLEMEADDLQTVLAQFPEYDIKPPSFAGDISLYRRRDV